MSRSRGDGPLRRTRREHAIRWGRLRRKACKQLRPEQEALVEEHHDAARGIACKLVRDSGIPIDVDDAIGCALVGLVDAAHRFDPNAGPDGSFMAFAYRRIRGEIIDHVRRNSLLSRTQLAEGKRARVLSFEALSESPEAESRRLGVRLAAPQGDHESTIDVRDALNGLNERERYVVTALAVGATCSELAGSLGISEPRVGSIATFARAKLVRDTAA